MFSKYPTDVVAFFIVINLCLSLGILACVVWLVRDVMLQRRKAAENAKKRIEERYEQAFLAVREKFQEHFPADFVWGDKGFGWYFEASHRIAASIRKETDDISISVTNIRTHDSREFRGVRAVKSACIWIDVVHGTMRPSQWE